MTFLVDAQLPPALARFISGMGHTCNHVADVNLLTADDSPIWNFAVRTGAVIITKDEDFPKRRILSTQGPAVVWLRVGNCSNKALIQWLQPLWPQILQRLHAGEPIVEVV